MVSRFTTNNLFPGWQQKILDIHRSGFHTLSVLETIRTEHFNLEDRSALRFRDFTPRFSCYEDRIYAISDD